MTTRPHLRACSIRRQSRSRSFVVFSDYRHFTHQIADFRLPLDLTFDFTLHGETLEVQVYIFGKISVGRGMNRISPMTPSKIVMMCARSRFSLLPRLVSSYYYDVYRGMCVVCMHELQLCIRNISSVNAKNDISLILRGALSSPE